MQTLNKGYKGVSTLVILNWDRFIMTAALVAALYASAYIALL